MELQYFVAGLLLLLPPALVLGALYGTWRLLQALAVWERRREERRKRVNAVVGVLLFGGLIGFAVTSADWVARWLPIPAYLQGVFLTAFIAGFAVNTVLATARTPASSAKAPAGGPRGPAVRLLEWMGVVFGGLLVVNFGLLVVSLLVVAMLIGSAKVLPVLPQALGGAAPRCARFDVDPTKVSPELAAELFEPGASAAPATATGRRRSRQVLVHHSGGESILFKLPERAYPSAPAYELKRSAIDAVSWCGKVVATRN